MIRSRKLGLAAMMGMALLLSSHGASAGGAFSVVHAFQGKKDGEFPEAGLALDPSGNVYGTTFGSLGSGGSNDIAPGKHCSKNCGNVYSLIGGNTVRQIYPFAAGADDGAFPTAEVLVLNGTIYGTTQYGKATGCGGLGCGTLFEITADGKHETDVKFCQRENCADGAFPHAGLTLNTDQKLYGTASLGGSGNGTLCGSSFGGCGTIYAFSKKGPKPVYSFCTKVQDNLCVDGAVPVSKLVADGAGNLYGTTQFGGAHGGGTIFKLASDGSESVIYSFCSQIDGGGICTDGSVPQAGLALFGGNFYGTTKFGGTACAGNPGCGVVFRIAPNGSGYTVLHSFTGGADGDLPQAQLLSDDSGNLYGTTLIGGGGDCGGNDIGCGTVFRFAAADPGTYEILYAFGLSGNHTDGAYPQGVLILQNGTLYGVTKVLGDRKCKCGTLYSLALGAGPKAALH